MTDAATLAPPADARVAKATRLRVVVRGAVQGVGFRPFVYRLAEELGLGGWVCNTAQGVIAEVEGAAGDVEDFLLRLEPERPPHARVTSLEPTFLPPTGAAGFEIRPSEGGAPSALVLPDIATCPECLAEVLDPANRRFRYPFTNCTHCGPRFSIIEALPYDRLNTSMRRFAMCDACRAEYDDPRDRRFHAQPNACPHCGPHLALWDRDGAPLAVRDDALLLAAEALREGAVVAVKGLGGFHLLADARSDDGVQTLRRRKLREEKPLALMVATLADAEALCHVSPLEARLLQAPEAPIVLLERKPDARVSEAVAPGNPSLGVTLPATPLHHLLLRELGFPVVATSGNRSDEPICTDEHEAVRRLAGIADLFLVHDRPIVRHVDDSVARVVLGRELVLRRARGYAPLPVDLGPILPAPPSRPVLAVGAHLKSTVALVVGTQAFVSQHVGDLETPQALDAFRRVAADLGRLYATAPAAVAHDLHPDYASTQHARALGLPTVAVQHHVAHVLAAMAENGLRPPVLGVAWDGTGLGTDGTIWGGELLRVTSAGWERAGHLLPFPLPGGDRAVREPRRSALGLLWTLFGDALFDRDDLPLRGAFTGEEWAVLRQMLRNRLHVTSTTSAGRLFDGVAALVGLRARSTFEGQAAMELEWVAASEPGAAPYSFALVDNTGPLVLDWRPTVEAVLADVAAGVPAASVSARFHAALAAMIAAAAVRLGERDVVLTGGCFQNRLLTEGADARLRAVGLRPHGHQRVPPGDGGVSLGQLVAALQPAWNHPLELNTA